MNSIRTIKALSTKHAFAGRSWFYEFREIPGRLNEESWASYANALVSRYSKLSKSWNIDKNSEWIARIYLSGRMILAATVQLSSYEFAARKNLKSVLPYLAYYSILSLLRAVVFTLPEREWDEGNIIKLPHGKLASLVQDCIRAVDLELSKELRNRVDKARAARELISYWHPTSEGGLLEQFPYLIETCTFLAEVAQFNSEILEASVQKNASLDHFKLDDRYIHQLSQVELHGEIFVDFDDIRRLDYIGRKYPMPANIRHTLTEGHVDDFFISWCADSGEDQLYDPDEDHDIIFDFV